MADFAGEMMSKGCANEEEIKRGADACHFLLLSGYYLSQPDQVQKRPVMKPIAQRKNVTCISHVADPAAPLNPKAPEMIPRINKRDKAKNIIFHLLRRQEKKSTVPPEEESTGGTTDVRARDGPFR